MTVYNVQLNDKQLGDLNSENWANVVQNIISQCKDKKNAYYYHLLYWDGKYYVWDRKFNSLDEIKAYLELPVNQDKLIIKIIYGAVVQ